jgi:hypothetical protein
MMGSSVAQNGPQEQSQSPSEETEEQQDRRLTRTLIWIGVAGLSAALAFTVVRVIMSRRPPDPTSQRIQQLIDEANSLLKTLDDKRNL